MKYVRTIPPKNEPSLNSHQSQEHADAQQPDRYQSLLNTLNGYEEFTLDVNGQIISSNLEAVAITGYEEWEVIGKNFAIFYSSVEQVDRKPERDLALAKAMGSHVINDVKYRKRNTPFWASMEITALRRNSNSIKCFRVKLKDTTHLVVNHDKVRTIEEEYFGLFNNSFVGVVKFNLETGELIALNQKAKEILNNAPEHRLFREFFADETSYDYLINTLVDQGNVDNYEFQLASSDISFRWININCVRLMQTNVAEGVLIDQTDRKREFQELQRTKAQLDNFLYHASHDLRAPLTTIMGLVNLMKIELKDSKAITYGHLIDERVCHMDAILHDLMTVVLNNNAKVAIDSLDFNSIMETIIREITITFPNLSIMPEIDDDGRFASDEMRVSTIIKSLLTNAARQTTPPDFHLVIIVKVKANAACCQISVEDNAIQYTQEVENIDNIFKEFHRSNTFFTGSGLNLFIAKSMVDVLRGSIEVSQTKNNSFTLTLPNLSWK